MRRAKIPEHALFHVAAFLGAYDKDFIAMKPGHSSNDSGVVAKAAIAMNFADIGENSLDVVEGLRPLRMPR